MPEPTINTIGVTPNGSQNEERIDYQTDALYPGMTEEEFRDAVNFRLPREKSYWTPFNIKSRSDRNARYWEGDQLDKASINDDQEKWVENVLLRNIETLISLMTSRTPELTATAAYKNDKTRGFALSLRRILQTEWEVYQSMQLLTSRAIRNHQINLLGVLKCGYDPDTDEFWTEEIPATNLIISKKGDLVAEYIKDKDLGYLLDTFPEKKNELLTKYGISQITAITKKIRQTPVEYLEIWLDNGPKGVLGWKCGEIVLGVDNNPHFDYVGEDVPMMDEMGQPMIDPATQQPQAAKVFYNFFKRPKHPYIFLQYLNRGIHVFDNTTLLEQGIGNQDWINKRKRQIGLNADSTNGTWVSSGDFISQEEFDKVEGTINEKIWLANGKPADGIQKVVGEQLPQYVYQDLIDSRQSLNTLMGVENATLGSETNNNTLGQDVMQRQQNMGRADGYVRLGVEVMAQKWFEYMYHLYLVYRTSEKAIAVPETTDFESENICFSRKDVPLIQKVDGSMIVCPMVLQVKANSTLPRDEVFEYKKATENADKYAPIDYFKKIGEPNPRELSKNLLIWQADPFFFFKDDPQIMELQQALAARAQAQQQQEQDATQTQNAQNNEAKMKIEQMKQDGKNGEAKGKDNGNGATPQGIANALRAEMQQAGMAH